MAENNIYTVGGTIKTGEGIYITRKADFELLELCKKGDFAYILSPRQVGKSSLMVRTAKELTKDEILNVIIDLSALGVKVNRDEWYLGLLVEIKKRLNLDVDVIEWWDKNSRLGATQRMSYFLSEIVLQKTNSRIVIFVDEIDSTLSMSFADDFFAAIRFIYNSRAVNSDLEKLSFVLIGVATPSDLISDPKRTPFNIGKKVDLAYFTLDEAQPLSKGLNVPTENAQEVLQWIFDWTNGHPYLTQIICSELSKFQSQIRKKNVEDVVKTIFLGEGGEKNGNLQFVRDMLTQRAKNPRDVLKVYREVLLGGQVVDDEKSIDISHLKLSGIVRTQHGLLQVSNKIYQTVFDIKWVEEQLTLLNELFKFIIFIGASLLLIGVFFVVIKNFYIGFALFWGIIGLMNQKERDKLVERLEMLVVKPAIYRNDNGFEVPLYPRLLFGTIARSLMAFIDKLKREEKKYYSWVISQYEKQKSVGDTLYKQSVYLIMFLLFLSVLQGGVVSVTYSFLLQFSNSLEPNQASQLIGLISVFIIGVYRIIQLFRGRKTQSIVPIISVGFTYLAGIYLVVSSLLAIMVIFFGASNQFVDFLSAILAPVNMLIALTFFKQIEIFKGIQAFISFLSWIVYGDIFLIIRIGQVFNLIIMVLFDIGYRLLLFCLFIFLYYVTTPIDTFLSTRVFSRAK